MNLFNNPKLSALCRHRFGAVKKRHGRCGFLPGVCARPKRRRVERSAALLLGCDPGNLPMRRRGKWADGAAGRPLSKESPTHHRRRFAPANRGWRPLRSGLRPHEPKRSRHRRDRLRYLQTGFVIHGPQCQNKDLAPDFRNAREEFIPPGAEPIALELLRVGTESSSTQETAVSFREARMLAKTSDTAD
jgi:hypothetical protein